jgi:coenzyme PQQ biosynthesis protein PqqD
VSPESRPRLAPKVRLRLDKKTHEFLLLFPERGILLNPTAAEIIKRCNGKNTVTMIIDHLMQIYDNQPRQVIETEILNFLQQFHGYGLIQVET